MSTNTLTLIVIADCMIALVGISLLAIYFGRKKINALGVIEEIGTGLGYGQAIADAVKPFLPGIAGNIIDIVLKYAEQAVARVEATYKAALITGAAANDTRSTEAVAMIKSALSLQGIAITSDTEKLIDTVIPLLVMALPKTHEVDAAPEDETPEAVEEPATEVTETAKAEIEPAPKTTEDPATAVAVPVPDGTAQAQ